MSLSEIYNQRFGKPEVEKAAEAKPEVKAEEVKPVETKPEAEKVAEAAPAVAAQEPELTKEAKDALLEKAIAAVSEEEAEKLATVIEVFDGEGLQFDHDLDKLAAAAEIVDEHAEYEAEVAKQAEDLDAAGRIMARGLADELAKIAAEAEKPAAEAAPVADAKVETPAPATLSEKLAKATEPEKK
ncbi:MAG: hypothetical protein ABFE07_29140 [Armatimonadia bacterium]